MERTSAPNASAERGRHETGPICSMAFAMTGSRRAISCVAAARLHLGMAKSLRVRHLAEVLLDNHSRGCLKSLVRIRAIPETNFGLLF